jgi:hypothetical protein
VPNDDDDDDDDDDCRRVREIVKSDYQLLHVCPSIRMEQLGSQLMDFHEIGYLNIFRKSAQKFQV